MISREQHLHPLCVAAGFDPADVRELTATPGVVRFVLYSRNADGRMIVEPDDTVRTYTIVVEVAA